MTNIPLTGGAINAHQIFTILLGDNLLEFTLNYITVEGPSWSMDISREGVNLAYGVMLEPNANLLAGLYLDIGDLSFTGDDVTLDNLGSSNQLSWEAPQ